MLTLGSLFDGIGGWQISAIHNGVRPVWSSEVEKFPLALTKVRFPNTKQLGDITKINGAEIEPVDIMCAGVPCQGTSIAGRRLGLNDRRSGLFYEFIRVFREMREATKGKYPKFIVWENPTGAFSSNKGNDFRVILEEITKTEIPMPRSGKWATAGMVRSRECEVAWRVLDAQYWGVPQRRKRIFLVADFRTDGRGAGEILFVEEGLSRNTDEGRKEREGITSDVKESVRDASTVEIYDITHNSEARKRPDGLVQTLTSRMGTGGNQVPIVFEKDVAVYDMVRRHDVCRPQEDGTMPTVTASYGTGGNNVPIVVKSVTENGDGDVFCSDTASTLTTGGGKPGQGYPCICFEPGAASREGGHIYTDNKAPTLRAKPGDNFPTVYAIEGGGFRPSHNGKGYSDSGVAPTLSTAERHSVCYGFDLQGGKAGVQIFKDICPTLMTSHDMHSIAVDIYNGNITGDKACALTTAAGISNGTSPKVLETNRSVRKLTPLECERLQGLPDYYTFVDDKTCSDSARYKGLGNGMAQPCADYIIKRITEVTNGN